MGEEVAPEEARRIGEDLGLGGSFVILYSGTFESYQGCLFSTNPSGARPRRFPPPGS
jgi:hypothetical protein